MRLYYYSEIDNEKKYALHVTRMHFELGTFQSAPAGQKESRL